VSGRGQGLRVRNRAVARHRAFALETQEAVAHERGTEAIEKVGAQLIEEKDDDETRRGGRRDHARAHAAPGIEGQAVGGRARLRASRRP
jgi:hypothetical protein